MRPSVEALPSTDMNKEGPASLDTNITVTAGDCQLNFHWSPSKL